MAPSHADVADDREDQVLGHQVRRHLAVEDEAHGRRHLEPQLAGAQDEAGVGVADAGGELAERAGGAGVAVGAEQDLAGPGVAFFGQGDVADALVLGRCRRRRSTGGSAPSTNCRSTSTLRLAIASLVKM